MLQVRLHALPAGLASTVWLASACEHSTEPTAAALRPHVLIEGVALDSSGRPYPPAPVRVRIWPPDLETDSLVARFGSFGLGVLDDDGSFRVQLGRFGHDVLDSVQVNAGPFDCHGSGVGAQREAVALRPYLFDTVRVKLAANGPPPVAPALTVGTLCGAGTVGTGASESFVFTYDFFLAINDISDSVRGRFDINYTASYGDDIGRFAAARTATELIINLVPDLERASCPIGRRIRIALTPDGHLGLARWDATRCWEYRPFYFVAGTFTAHGL